MINDDGIVKAKLDFGVDYYKGEKGDDGFSPSITTTEIDNGYTLTITNKDGEESIDILNGRDGGDIEEVWDSISELEQRVNEIPINTFDLSDRIDNGTGEKSVRTGSLAKNRATGNYSLAEGYNTWANGSYSHAEGNSSIAAGNQAHAEGNQTHAQGMNAHAEGISTYAYDNAHAEGIRTIARAQQHVEGKYNIDMNDENIQAVVGNGTADNARSNSFVRDWDGNEYHSGQVFVECNFDEGEQGLNYDGYQVATREDLDAYATKSYVENVIAGIETGALKRSIVSALPSTGIDENTIYMVERTNSESGNVYDEYLYVENNWEKIGSTDVDLTDYWKKSDLTFTNGLTNSNGTVSWDLSDRIKAGGQRGAVAIGYDTTASGDCSYAEGYGTKATSGASHAEGELTQAIGSKSHAEGNSTRAKGGASHAEGNSTRAEGRSAHAEGNSTVAQSNEQHAEGMFNIGDSNSIFQNIAGNGTAENARSNSFARDWNGNEYLAGNLYVGCNDYSTTANGLTTENAGGSKVATESYVDQAIADIPSSGGGSEYTAGVGIDIDSNNVISKIPFSLTTITAYQRTVPSGDAKFTPYAPIYQTGPYNDPTTQKATIVEKLKQGYICYCRYSSGYQGSANITLEDLSGVSGGLPYIDFSAFSNGVMYISIRDSGWTIQTGQYFYWDGKVFYCWNDFGEVTRNIKVKYGSNTGYLGTVLNNINTRIPAAPTADGSYKLTSTTTSGTSTYSWENDTSSGSNIPTPPSTDGNYILTCAVNNGSITYTWVDATIGGTY